MSSISIIGLGSMASALAGRALAGGNTVEVIGRDPAKAKELAAALGGATVGTVGTAPAGDIVILAVPYASAAAVVSEYGDALHGKVIIDITNTFTPDVTGLVTPDGSSGAQEIAKAAPAGAHVVKAFNTLFGHVLAAGSARVARWTCSSPATTRRPRPACRRSSRAWDCARWTPGRCRWRRHWRTRACCRWAWSPTPSSTPTSSSASTFSAERTRTTTSRATSRQSSTAREDTHSTYPRKDSHMRVFVTGGTGHAGSYIIPELIAAGHEVTGLARSDTAAAALSALGAKVRRGDLEDLDGLKEAAADSDGVIHVAHRQDLLPSGGMDAVAAAELPIMLAYGEALAGTGKPLVAAGSIGSSGNLGRPATEEDPALPSGDEHKGTLRVRNVVETAVVGLAEQGVRSSIVRLPLIAHSTTDSAGFLPGLIALAKEKGFAGYPGDGANLWYAVHIRDVASVFRLALEKGPAGRYWHAIAGRGHPVPRDRRGHRQPSGPAHREHSRGRH